MRGFAAPRHRRIRPLGHQGIRRPARYQKYDKFKGPGDLEKKQFNAMIRQDFENENFISLAFHYNRNRNAFYRTTSNANYAGLRPRLRQHRYLHARSAPTFNVIDNDNASPVASTPTLLNTDNPPNPSSCTNFYGVRINPSDTGNVRMQSLWHLGEKLRLTFDPSWQYTLANGGGTTTITETLRQHRRRASRRRHRRLPGFDLNGDGDILDTVRFYSPNTTNTKRWGATASLIWDLNDDQPPALGLHLGSRPSSPDRHVGPIGASGNPENVFAGREGQRVYAADGEHHPRPRPLLDRRAEPVRARVARPVRRRQVHRHGGRARAVLHARAQPVLLHAERRQRQLAGTIRRGGGTLCIARAPDADAANGNVTFVRRTR